jgi:glutamate-1-semialdehyde 2,1-aminomutase
MTSTLNAQTHPLSDALLQRAERVVPNAMYGHQDARGLWPGAPQFVSRTSGSRIWDADGHEYIDLLCGSAGLPPITNAVGESSVSMTLSP